MQPVFVWLNQVMKRFVREKSEYKGPHIVPKRRAKKNPLAPRRPMSAFLKFSQIWRKKVKRENPDMANTDVSRLLGEMWRNASVHEKRPYREQEEKERAVYKEDMKRFRDIQAQKDAGSRTSHQLMQNHLLTRQHWNEDGPRHEPHALQLTPQQPFFFSSAKASDGATIVAPQGLVGEDQWSLQAPYPVAQYASSHVGISYLAQKRQVDRDVSHPRVGEHFTHCRPMRRDWDDASPY